MTKHARICGETRGRRLDIETRCMQENVERQRRNQIWNEMNSGSCWGAPGRKFRYWNKMNAGSCWGAPGRKLRYWNKMNARSLWRGKGRGPGGSIDPNHMSAKILNPNDDACKKLWRDEGEKPGYWNCMNAGSCWEARVCESCRILKQDACKKLRERPGGCHIWSQMNAGNCWGAPGVKFRYWIRWMQEVAERLGGSIDFETQWMQEM